MVSRLPSQQLTEVLYANELDTRHICQWFGTGYQQALPHISVAYQDSWIDRHSRMLDINNTNGSNNILESITIKNNNNDSANKLTIEYRYKGQKLRGFKFKRKFTRQLHRHDPLAPAKELDLHRDPLHIEIRRPRPLRLRKLNVAGKEMSQMCDRRDICAIRNVNEDKRWRDSQTVALTIIA